MSMCPKIQCRGDEIRTHDLCVPNAALYQLSHTPKFHINKSLCRREDSNLHGVLSPRALKARVSTIPPLRHSRNSYYTRKLI